MIKASRLSVFVEKMYATIPEKDKKQILDDKKGLSKSGNYIRLQSYIPVSVYVTLAYFGAFQNSETEFFTSLACSFIEKKAIEFGMNKMFAMEKV